jgi:mannose/fructose/N-acetylgalactosamine-specific phosphotransferase system component IID
MLTTWVRTLIVQASWNYDRMVGIGVAYAMEPLLRDLPGGKTNGRYAAALKRVAGFFNAHPYLTGMAAGALARVEYDGVPEAQADRLRRALIGPLGSVGDQLIWAGWLPLSMAVGLIVAVLASVPAGVVAFLILYNVVHLGLRSWGLAAGWRAGVGVAGELAGRVIHGGLRFGAAAAPFSLGVALPLVASWLLQDFGDSERVGAAVVGSLGLLLARVLAPTLSGVRLGLLFLGAAILAGWLWQ